MTNDEKPKKPMLEIVRELLRKLDERGVFSKGHAWPPAARELEAKWKAVAAKRKALEAERKAQDRKLH